MRLMDWHMGPYDFLQLPYANLLLLQPPDSNNQDPVGLPVDL